VPSALVVAVTTMLLRSSVHVERQQTAVIASSSACLQTTEAVPRACGRRQMQAAHESERKSAVRRGLPGSVCASSPYQDLEPERSRHRQK
jgi:hypothetical protein